MKRARESTRGCVCVRASPGERYITETVKTTALDTDSKTFLQRLAKSKKMTHPGRGSVGGDGGVSLSSADLSVGGTDGAPLSPGLLNQRNNTTRPAVKATLDTNLSSANKSQTHQLECYFWQAALYKRQTMQRGQRATRGTFKQLLLWLVDIMFASCIIFTYWGFRFLIRSYWLNQGLGNVVPCSTCLSLSSEEKKTQELAGRPVCGLTGWFNVIFHSSDTLGIHFQAER